MFDVIVTGVLFLMGLSLFATAIDEAKLTWQAVTAVGMRHTPANLSLMLYCRVEAANYIGMQEFQKILRKHRLDKR